MKIYTTVEPVPSRMLAVARLLLAAGPLPEEELLVLLQPREDTRMAKNTLDAGVECGLVLRSKNVWRLAPNLFPQELKASELEETLSLVLARLLPVPEVSGTTNGFATLCAWLLHQPILEMPGDRGGLKKAAQEQGLSLSELQIQSDARWDNLVYWAVYLGLVRQTRQEPCAGILPDPTLYLRRHLAQLLPAGEEVAAEAFRSRLGECCPVLDGGSVRTKLLARIDPTWPVKQLSDAVTFSIERLERNGELRAWTPDDQRTFLLTPDGRKIAYLTRTR
jgi:hypothetical protein